MASRERPARQAVKEGSGALLHWSSAVSAVAVVVVAHWLAGSGGTGNRAGLVFGGSFAVFALLLPAVSLLREYVDRRTTRLQEVLRNATVSAETLESQRETLESQRKMFAQLAGAVAPLQRGIVLAVLAAIASSVAIVAPRVTVWDHAPGFLVFSLADLLTGLALVCLIGTVAAMFPFTWHLLILSNELRRVERSISSLQSQPAQPAQPAQRVGGHPGTPTHADGTGTDAAPGA